MTSGITYAIEGVPLDDADGRWKLLAGTAVGSAMSVRSSVQPLPGVDGESPAGYEPLDAPSLVLQVRIYGSSYAEMMGRYRALLPLLSPTGAVTVTKTIDGTDYTTTGRGKSVTVPDFAAKIVRVTATLRLPDVYWRGSSADWSQSNPTMGTDYEVSMLADSSAPVDDALLLLTGPWQSPKIACAGAWASLNLTLASTDKALIDCETWTVRVGSGVTWSGGGTVKSGALRTSGGPYALRLIPKMAGTDPTDTAVTVTPSGAGTSSATKLQVRAKPAFLV